MFLLNKFRKLSQECLLKQFEYYLISFSFLAFITADFLTKILVNYGSDVFFRYGAITKLFFFAGIIFILIKKHKKKYLVNSKYIILVVFLSFIFILNQLTIFEKTTLEDKIFNLNYFFRSIYSIVIIIYLFNNINSKAIKTWIKLFKIIIFINSILIIIGLLFDIKLFESYYSSSRFGYQGLLLYHSESGYIYFLAAILFYKDYVQNRSTKNLLLNLFILIIMFLIGTKKAILLSIFFLVYLSFKHYANIKKKWSILVSTLLLFLVLFNYQALFKFLEARFVVISDVYREKGFLTALFSYRNLTVSEKLLPFLENFWQEINFIIGGPAFKTFRVEMELFDVYVFFGIFGLVIYVYLLRNLILVFTSKENKFMIFGVFTASFFSGNFLASINVFFVFSIILIYLSDFYQKNELI